MNNSDSSLSSNEEEEEEMIQIFLDQYEVLSIEMNEVIKCFLFFFDEFI